MNPLPCTNDTNHCVENGVWTPIPITPPAALDQFTLKLKDVDPSEHSRITGAGKMSFHMAGCAGDFCNHQPQTSVAKAMAEQIASPGSATPASFLYHLGDVVYKDEDKADPERDDQTLMYNTQFYGPYHDYPRHIFAIAGNHDGKVDPKPAKSAATHFLANFCAKAAHKSPDNHIDDRPAMTQPYVYWRLDTPYAYIIGLYTNIANGGILDDPHTPDSRPQRDWLVAQLQDVARRNTKNSPRKAVLVTLHYPPYSGATNFSQRGDPTLGPTQAAGAQPVAAVLQQAFSLSGQRPDAIVSAHAHLYQRLTYCYDDGWELPCLIAGSGGHSPVENLWEQCDGKPGPAKSLPFAAVLPAGLVLPPGHSVRLVAHNSQSFGFLRMTLEPNCLTGEFFTAYTAHPDEPVALDDSFRLDLVNHRVLAG
jgi:Calcineurin-like phosphoesterase